ncbi:hypothetical protein PENTCL1PPCAC_18076, partial [Pristionchus entomophagus]
HSPSVVSPLSSRPLTMSTTPVDKISRFTVSIISISLMFTGSLTLETLSTLGATWVAGTLSPLLAFFIFEWIYLHSRQLSRQRRAFFDEVNVLETYQPRARTHGHLFVPDPPTPGPSGQTTQSDGGEEVDPAKKAFNANRDNHYANMYQEALRLNKEMEMQSKIGKDPCAMAVDADMILAPVEFDSQGRPKEEVAKAKSSSASSVAASTAKSIGTKTPKPDDVTSL